MNLALPVECVSDTAFLTAFCRAVETERPDAHFRDPYARTLAGTRGEQLLQQFPGGESNASGCIVRTCLFDSLIMQALEEDAVDTVVNLGAGLDTRPYRLPLKPSLCWIEIDNPAILAFKAKKLDGQRPICDLNSLPLDVADADARCVVFERIATAAKQVLLITEGLLGYMTPTQVGLLALDLHAWPQFRWWLSDVASPDIFRLVRGSFSEYPNSSRVRLLFAPQEGAEFFRQYGWETCSCRWCLEESRRLQRWFLPESVFATLSNEQQAMLQRLSAVAKLKRAERRRNGSL
jgi:methyltransferase (TIGR00027 family)